MGNTPEVPRLGPRLNNMESRLYVLEKLPTKAFPDRLQITLGEDGFVDEFMPASNVKQAGEILINVPDGYTGTTAYIIISVMGFSSVSNIAGANILYLEFGEDVTGRTLQMQPDNGSVDQSTVMIPGGVILLDMQIPEGETQFVVPIWARMNYTDPGGNAQLTVTTNVWAVFP